MIFALIVQGFGVSFIVMIGIVGIFAHLLLYSRKVDQIFLSFPMFTFGFILRRRVCLKTF